MNLDSPVSILVFKKYLHFSIYVYVNSFPDQRVEINPQKMTDSKYFTTTKKGEIFELKSELNNDKKEKKKEAVKKVLCSSWAFDSVV